MKAFLLGFLFLGVALSGWLTYLLLATAPWSTFNEQGSQLMVMEWGRISLVDLYAGFFLGLVFIWTIEPKLWVKVLMTLTLPVLGNPILAIWVLIRMKALLRIEANNQSAT